MKELFVSTIIKVSIPEKKLFKRLEKGKKVHIHGSTISGENFVDIIIKKKKNVFNLEVAVSNVDDPDFIECSSEEEVIETLEEIFGSGKYCL